MIESGGCGGWVPPLHHSCTDSKWTHQLNISASVPATVTAIVYNTHTWYWQCQQAVGWGCCISIVSAKTSKSWKTWLENKSAVLFILRTPTVVFVVVCVKYRSCQDSLSCPHFDSTRPVQFVSLQSHRTFNWLQKCCWASSGCTEIRMKPWRSPYDKVITIPEIRGHMSITK